MKQHRIWNAVLFTGALLVMAALSAVLLPMLNKESGLSLICIPVTLIYAFGAIVLFRGSRAGKESLEPLWVGAVLAIFGHTHTQLLEYKEGIYLLNPGAMRENEYALVTVDSQGGINCRLHGQS